MACHQKHAKKHSTKSRRVQKQNDEIKKSFKEDVADKKEGVNYQSGIGFVTPVTPTHDKQQQKDKVCPHCGLKGHLRRTHRSCLKHRTPAEFPKIAVENEKKAPEEVAVVTDVKNTERKSSMAQPEVRSEETGYAVLSSAYGNSQLRMVNCYLASLQIWNLKRIRLNPLNQIFLQVMTS